MNWLYFWLDIGSLSIPFIASFHPKLRFYKKWPQLFIGIVAMMLFFIPWDILFTKYGIWGFNPFYLTGVYLWKLPIEEWLFFICIPYACTFTYHAFHILTPKLILKEKYTKILSLGLIILSVVIAIIHYNKWYTVINYGYATILLIFSVRYAIPTLQRFYIVFIVILVPFFLINGLLTGSFIEDQVVWYNNYENLQFRIGTIPVEDTMYAFTMLLTVLLFITYKSRE
ncbi:lycopene cyclase domain-containing protein [Aquimarina sp. TRL1]|uniref:lycopene cyclase domain-containing protein n=1 Tax=Aquimarina sp. (strain TRL1) TaxID=2736252 RepID=UPI001589E32A|nr:lycopene cyclase domain-containing protein [Aquimarina sp. TRL1]QKX07104.1 lycopene cyclase domain-containing protein [Aquimarina sp. TRL1]